MMSLERDGSFVLLDVTSDVGSGFLVSAKKEVRAKNSNARGTLFSMQSKRTLKLKI